MTNAMVALRSADLAVAPTSRDDRVEADLAQLAGLDLAGLRQRWRRMVGRPAPGHLARPLLCRLLAYRIQAAAFGDLNRETARQLDRLGRGMTDEPDRQAGGRAAEPIPPAAQASRPGTLLIREWRGSLQRVTVLEQGFAWGGRSYDSLSSVARPITGTNWNGPRFFGLRTRGKKKAPGQATESGGGAR